MMLFRPRAVPGFYVLLLLTLTAPLGKSQAVSSVSIGAGTTTTNVAPGAVITITGTNFAQGSANVGDVTGGMLPVTLGGVRVSVGGVDAPIIMVSPTTITAQAPFEVSAGQQPLIVRSGTSSSPSFSVTVTPTAPTVFSDAAGAIIEKPADFSIIGAANPAGSGDVLVFYATGLGQTTPALRTGMLADRSTLARTAPVSVSVGGQDAEVVYSIATPGYVGLYQVAIRMPAGPVGTVPVILRMGATASPPVATVAGITRAARLDPEMNAVFEQFLALGPRPLQVLTPEQARTQPSFADAVRRLLERQGRSTVPEPVGKVEDRTIPGGAGQIPARIYTPQGAGPFPVIVYFHGGGFVIATVDTYDASARALTHAANAIVVSVEYRKAPENKFPAAPEDAYAAVQWAFTNSAAINARPNLVAVAGESAGGNLATVVCMMARDRGGRMPVHQLLVYPVANLASDMPSYEENGVAPFLTVPALRWFAGHYLRTRDDARNPYVSPLIGNVQGLPPATVITDGFDPLRDEGALYADKLRQAAISVDYRNYAAEAHEFFGMTTVVEAARQAVQQAGMNLRTAFGQP